MTTCLRIAIVMTTTASGLRVSRTATISLFEVPRSIVLGFRCNHLLDADGGSEESDTERDEPSSSAAVERAYRKPQSFKLVGVDSSREFNSFVPSHDDSLTRPLVCDMRSA